MRARWRRRCGRGGWRNQRIVGCAEQSKAHHNQFDATYREASLRAGEAGVAIQLLFFWRATANIFAQPIARVMTLDDFNNRVPVGLHGERGSHNPIIMCFSAKRMKI